MNKKILIVDDNRMMVSFMIKTLEQDGHEVFSAEDGLGALEMLTSLTPDIMFIDLVMPRIGGTKLCQIIREMSRLKDCYIVIVSGAVGEMDLDYTKSVSTTDQGVTFQKSSSGNDFREHRRGYFGAPFCQGCLCEFGRCIPVRCASRKAVSIIFH